MFRYVLFFFLFFYPVILLPQPYLVSGPPAGGIFTVDDIGNQVYYFDHSLKAIWRSNIKTGEYEVTNFTDLPEFMNSGHHAIVYDREEKCIYLYNLDLNTKTVLADSLTWMAASFLISPNETRVSTGSYIFDLSSKVWLKPIPDKYFRESQWSSDSSQILLSGDNILTEYFVESGHMDTLLVKEEYSFITSIAFNYQNKKVYYGIIPPGEHISQLRSYDPTTDMDML